MFTPIVFVFGILIGTTFANLDHQVKELEETAGLAPRVHELSDRIDGLHQRLNFAVEQLGNLNHKIGSINANWINGADLIQHDIKELFERWDNHFKGSGPRFDDDGDRQNVARNSKISTE